MQFTTSLITLAMAVTLVSAAPSTMEKREDNRIVFTYPSTYADQTSACEAWNCKCINYHPIDTTLSFFGFYCQPGAMGVKNATEITAYCSFTKDAGKTTQTVSRHVAKTGNFTLV